MAETKTERGTCRFVVKEAEGGRSAIVVQLSRNVGPLTSGVLGFDLLSSVTPEQANKIADILNDGVIDLFVVLAD
jgi:hypothetical protein